MPSLIDRFVPDAPFGLPVSNRDNLIVDCVNGCSAVELTANRDERGHLVELVTTRDDPVWSLVHVYQIFAQPGSLRGWVYHARQFDRLAFTNGRVRVVLHDLREGSPTFGKTNSLIVGEALMALVTIAPFVAHCVENIGESMASYVNMPTRPWDPGNPDKARLPASLGLIPYPGGS